MYSTEEFDKAKTKVLKYIMYKKRTEQEVKQKFMPTIEENLLEDVIAYLKEAGYINDFNYIDRAVREMINLKTLCKKEIQFKLAAKGIKRDLIEDYMEHHQEELEEYECQNAKKIVVKKNTSMEPYEIKNYLMKKGYREDAIREAMEEINE